MATHRGLKNSVHIHKTASSYLLGVLFKIFNGVPVLHIWEFRTSKNLVKLKTGHHLQSPDNCNKVPKVLYQGKNILGACKNAIWLLHCHKIIIEESYIF